MAKPRETAPDPPVESAEEEEEEEEEEEASSEESSESESETEPTQASQQTPKKSSSKTQATAASSSSDEDEEYGSDTDSETPLKKPDPNVKPIASKPMDDPKKTATATKKPRSKPNSSGPTSPTKPAKRTAAEATAGGDGDEKKDAKKLKRKSEAVAENSEKKGNSTDDSKKLFQRLWSEEDEIAILKGMIDYSEKKKADPVADLNAFLEFIKKSLHIDVSRTQLQDKIRRLKYKYKNNSVKAKKGNKERTFSKPHEQQAYDLSKKIWGNEKSGGEEKLNGTVVRKSRTKGPIGMTQKVDEVVERAKEVKDLVSDKNVVDKVNNVSFCPDSLGVEAWVMKNGMEVIKDEKKKAELEEKWRELKLKEIELLARRSELMAEQAKLILNDLK